MAQSYAEIAKEITIAAIEKGIIIAPSKSNFKDKEEMREYNQLRAEEVSLFYKKVASAVNDTYLGNFTNEIE